MNTQTENLDFRTPAKPMMSYAPVVFNVPERQVPLQMKVSMPAEGSNLPIIILSHGHGSSNFLSSMRGYGPLADFYAANGFVVIQPTHQSSKSLYLTATPHEGDLFWRSRAEDVKFILDHLEEIEEAVPGLKGRVDKEAVVGVGHSMGGNTIGLIAGMQITDPLTGKEISFMDSRMKAAVILGAPGDGKDLAKPASERFPILGHNNFAEMNTQTLVIAGDKDINPVFSERKDWRSDVYYLSNGPKCLLTVFGSEHILGGISGYDADETTDENPATVALVQKISLAYLKTALYPDDKSWEQAKTTLSEDGNALGKIDCKN